MGEFDTSFLLCQEGSSFLHDNEDPRVKNNFDPYFPPESDDEYVLTLIGKEATHFQSQNRDHNSFSIDFSDTSDQNSRRSAHLKAIQWIISKKPIFDFHFRTAYLSVAYLDQLISKRVIDIGQSWAVRVSMVACLSVAAKMEECNVPTFSQYEVNDFNGATIQKMEVVVMKTLGWKMDLITPFAYLDYFIYKFFPDARPEEMNLKATEFIMALIEEINLVDHRPSAIAAAAVLAAYDDLLIIDSLESKITEISLWGSLEKEHIHSYHKLLKEIQIKKNVTPAPSNVPQKRSRTSEVYANSSTRRRLTFEASDQHCPPKNTRRSS